MTDGWRRITIDPVTRVEGHGKVTLLLGADGEVVEARLHIVEFRGFEKFIQGRPYWEVPVLVQRLCGICPVSHHLAAAKAMDVIAGAPELTPSSEKLRRLLHYGQVLQSHALHFFYLASPDLLFGFDAPASKRSIFAVLQKYPEQALRGIKLRKFGQQIIEAISGKRIHGVAALPGGMSKHLSLEDRDALSADADQMVSWASDTVELVRQLEDTDRALYRDFGTISSNFMSLVRRDGALELYDGSLRAIDPSGTTLFEGVPAELYATLIHEQVKPWTYMKFPFLVSLGPDNGWYRVGSLARLNTCRFVSTPLAEDARRDLMTRNGHGPVQAALAYHEARMIELLHCAELIRDLLRDQDVIRGELMRHGSRTSEGVGVVEAPRGTLIHYYQVGANDLVEKAQLIVATANNNEAMNQSIGQVTRNYLKGERLTERLLNQVEVAIRAYDPCLSCATHAAGKMPLQLELIDAQGNEIDRLVRNSDGSFN
jgi:NAD-reducing hydrogenase large subunit